MTSFPSFKRLMGFMAIILLGTVSAAHAQYLYVASNGDNTVEQFSLTDATSSVVYTAPGSASVQGIAVDGSDNLYVGDYNSNAITVIPLGGGSPTTLDTGGFNSGGAVEGLFIDNANNLYIGNNVGNSTSNSYPAYVVPLSGGTPGPLSTSPLTVVTPWDFTMDNAGNLYIINEKANSIFMVPAGGGPTTTLDLGGLTLDHPAGLAYANGNLYVSNESNNTIDVISLTGGSSGVLDVGDLTLDTPRGLTIDNNDNLYVANLGANNILQISLDGGSDTVFGDADQPIYLTLSFGSEIPEPTTWALLVVGAGGLLLFRYLRQSRA